MDAQFPHTSKNIAGNNNKNLANLVYILQAVAVFTALPFIIAVIINYSKRSEVQGTLAESHFRWQIRTFWFSLLWGILGGILTLVLLGYAILLCNFIWLIYRILRGWLHLNDNQTMYNPNPDKLDKSLI